MPRARLLKPGFFANEELAECTFEARLLFAGLWTIADREGRLEDRPKRIKGELFPYENIDPDALLNELAGRGFIVRYVVDGVRYITIPSFKKHQSPHVREPASTIPPPPEHQTGTDLAPDKHPPSIPHPVSGGAVAVSGGAVAGGHGDARPATADAVRETPVPLPKKTVVTEEWLTDERELFRERLPASGFWSFDRVLQDRMNQPYFKRATDQRAYIHGQLENAAERWAAERQTNGARNGSKHARPDEDDPILRRIQLDREREAAGGM